MDMFKYTAAYAKEKLRFLLPNKRAKSKTSHAAPLSPTITQQCGQITPKYNKQRTWSQVMSLLPVYLLQLCYGMNSAFPAVITPQLSEPCSEFVIDTEQESWIVSLDNLLAPFICITSGFLQQKFGPLRLLMFSCIPYTVGWIVAALAGNAYHLYVSRIFVGISHAIISTTVYTIEITSREMRGSLSILESVLRCGGSVLMYSLALFFRWWEIASLCSVVPIMAFVVSMFVPESPVFLVNKGRLDEAVVNVSRTFGPEYDSLLEVKIISDNLEQLKQSKFKKSDYVRSIKNHPEIYKPFLIIVFLSTVQQFSGVSVIRAYVVKIFDEVFSDFRHHPYEHLNTSMLMNDCSLEYQTSPMAYTSAIVIGVCRLISSLMLARLLTNLPRRSMYFVSIILTIISLITFSTFSYLIYHPQIMSYSPLSIFQWASLVSACLLVFSVQLGVQTLPLLLSGEIFPADVRASCKGLTRAITCTFLVITVKLYPQLEYFLSLYGTFFMFSVFLIIFLPVVYFILPETKDLSLEMIQQYFTPQVTIWYTKSDSDH